MTFGKSTPTRIVPAFSVLISTEMPAQDIVIPNYP
jgi:hypothetical protein